jgi:hypothetical protein
MPSWKRSSPALLGALLALAFSPARAEAKGTHFVLELNTGLGESAYEDGDPGLAYGASFGFTWKWTGLPLRFALLGTVASRNTTIAGNYEGLSFSSDRRDLDVYIAPRLVIPIFGRIRVYGEVGLGERIRTETLRLGEDLEPLSATSHETLFIFAAGLQARLSTHFSLGIRGEIVPADPNPDLVIAATHVEADQMRTALLAQIGVHF